jgi:hypothetical protein
MTVRFTVLGVTSFSALCSCLWSSQSERLFGQRAFFQQFANKNSPVLVSHFDSDVASSSLATNDSEQRSDA